jgi:hypothetical protein
VLDRRPILTDPGPHGRASAVIRGPASRFFRHCPGIKRLEQFGQVTGRSSAAGSAL